MNSEKLIQITPVILSGGSGTRLWPLCRSGFPMQFLCLAGDESLFQLAAKRLAALGADDLHITKPLIVSNEVLRARACTLHTLERPCHCNPVAHRQRAGAVGKRCLGVRFDRGIGVSVWSALSRANDRVGWGGW